MLSEDVAEFAYRPGHATRSTEWSCCARHLSVEKGQELLFEEYRYFFYITNDCGRSAEEIVFLANDRCDQENLIEQLKNGVHAMRNPLDNLHSNWAYMVMASLAWTLKAWYGLMLPGPGRAAPRAPSRRSGRSVLRMEFKAFVNSLIRLPCQIVRAGGGSSTGCCPATRGCRCCCGRAKAMRRPHALLNGHTDVGVGTPRSAAAAEPWEY